MQIHRGLLTRALSSPSKDRGFYDVYTAIRVNVIYPFLDVTIGNISDSRYATYILSRSLYKAL